MNPLRNVSNMELLAVNKHTHETMALGKIVRADMSHNSIFTRQFTLFLFETEGCDPQKRLTLFWPIRHVIFNGPATIVFFANGDKQVAKLPRKYWETADDEDYIPLESRVADDRELAIMYCVLKHIYGRNWNKKVSRFSNLCEKYDGFTTVDVEKAFVHMLIEDREPGYFAQIKKAVDAAVEKKLLAPRGGYFKAELPTGKVTI